jgi:hypothetical protein
VIHHGELRADTPAALVTSVIRLWDIAVDGKPQFAVLVEQFMP